MYKLLLIGTLFLLTACCSCPNALPSENNPAIVGGYTTPIVFNWLEDSEVTSRNKKIKLITLVAKQNPNNQIIIFYGKNCKILATKLQRIFDEEGFRTKLIANKDYSKVDVGYIFIKFYPIEST